MNIFADYHHGGLYKSLKLLFEDKLGFNLYRPIGIEWFLNGYWNIADPYPDAMDTATQYLDINNRGYEAFKNLNGQNYIEDGIYYVYDPAEEIYHKGLTFDKFLEMDIDIVLSSIPAHDVTYARLIREHKPNAKHISQMGNVYQTSEVNNVMCSTAPYSIPEGKNVVFYHQMFDLDIFKYQSPVDKEVKEINNFINLSPMPDLFSQYKHALPEFNMRSFGASCPDGNMTGNHALAEMMSGSHFGWHVKPGGDGFGHIIHNWYACGRPIITNGSDYYDKLASLLLEDSVTCIDLEQGTFQDNVERIKKWSEPENHVKMCQNAYNRFREIVDYDQEVEDIKEFLDNLI